MSQYLHKALSEKAFQWKNDFDEMTSLIDNINRD